MNTNKFAMSLTILYMDDEYLVVGAVSLRRSLGSSMGIGLN